MKKLNKPNVPLEDLSQEEQIDLIIILGAFANNCKTQLQDSEDLPLRTILISCLKLYDMNLLHAHKKKDRYVIRTTQIPVSIIQHLVNNSLESDEEEFLSSRAVALADRFIQLIETNTKILEITKKKKSKKKK